MASTGSPVFLCPVVLATLADDIRILAAGPRLGSPRVWEARQAGPRGDHSSRHEMALAPGPQGSSPCGASKDGAPGPCSPVCAHSPLLGRGLLLRACQTSRKGRGHLAQAWAAAGRQEALSLRREGGWGSGGQGLGRASPSPGEALKVTFWSASWAAGAVGAGLQVGVGQGAEPSGNTLACHPPSLTGCQREARTPLSPQQ